MAKRICDKDNETLRFNAIFRSRYVCWQVVDGGDGTSRGTSGDGAAEAIGTSSCRHCGWAKGSIESEKINHSLRWTRQSIEMMKRERVAPLELREKSLLKTLVLPYMM